MTAAAYGSVAVRATRERDLDWVTRVEAAPENAPFVARWTREQHVRAIDDADVEHLLILAGEDGRRLGYLILTGLTDPNRSIELLRIVVDEKGRGYGRDALRLVKQLAFERWGAHRLWLDVVEHNERARRLYESEGFVVEGTLRDRLLRGEAWASLVVLSMLEDEYRDGLSPSRRR